jgi:hypothetical protein
MSDRILNNRIGVINGQLSERNQLAQGMGWDIARTVSVVERVDLDTTYSGYFCLGLEDVGHSGTQSRVYYWDTRPSSDGTDASQLINWAKSSQSGRQPIIRAIGYQTGDATIVKALFVRDNSTLQ